MKELDCGRRCARWSRLAFGLWCGVLATDARAEEPAASADACVAFQSETADKLLLIHARNACERRLSCTLDYTLTCQDADEKPTSRASKRAPFQLARKGNQDISLTAASCKQGWRIDELSWTCS